ncbi:DEAD/DEAH box helicase [Paenibacillus sp. GCM10027629]|uniref:DEAD/DEAH box helicase n=1 Tax=Paenibacillus sp. GCM10027629 TaxID=3273414 RepID=UPI003640661E
MKLIPLQYQQEKLLQGGASLEHFRLHLRAHEIQLQRGFDRLRCLDHIFFEPKPWQIEAALKVLREMRGSAILADEVGLGKTIEAGLIIKELLHRGMIQSILILVPAPLVEQWKNEMMDKFQISFYDVRDDGWEEHQLLISSLPLLARSGIRRAMLDEKHFDLMIVDEAHCLKNHATATYKFVFGIKRKNAILMSATPIQNDLNELYSLVNILKPGYFTTRRSFRTEYMQDRFQPKNVAKLRELLSQVMIRNRRSNTLVELPRRRVVNMDIEMNPIERQFYNGVVDFTKHIFAQYLSGTVKVGLNNTPVSMLLMMLLSLLKQNCSSPQSVIPTLEHKMMPKLQTLEEQKKCAQLIALGRAIRLPSKAEKLVEHILKNQEQAIVFSEYLATIELLKNAFQQFGISVSLYHGGLNALEKERSIQAFKSGKTQIFLSTEAGGQGLNLQVCRRMYNYDLPWNPMRIEQRIGRIHRFGQKDEVYIYTMPTRGTIDEYLLYILTSKVNLFEMVVGELDTILSFVLDDHESLEVRIGKLILGSKDSIEMELRLREIGEELLKAKEDWHKNANASAKILDEIGIGMR